MSLRDAAANVEELHQGPKCSMGKLLRQLDAEDVAYIDEMRADGRTWTHIAKVLKADGHHVSDYTLSRHYRGACSCL